MTFNHLPRFLRLRAVVALFVGLSAISVACSNDDDSDDDNNNNNNNNNNTTTYTLTQEMLNKATIAYIENKTGIHKAAGDSTLDMSHIAGVASADSSVRDLFANVDLKNASTVAPGTVIVKKAYRKKPDGTKGDLGAIVAMFKRESTYHTSGGNFEYIVIPINGVDESGSMPNGDLSKATARGELSSCVNCHLGARGGNEPFLYSK